MSGRRVEEAITGRVTGGVARLSAGTPVSTRTAAGLVALVPVAAATLYRVAHNAPGPLPAPLVEVATVALPAAVVGPALAALLVAGTADAPGERVGLAFAGGFGLVALASPLAWLPAATGVVFGGGLAAGSRVRQLRRDVSAASVRRAGVAVVLTAGVVASLAATAGVAAATLRPLGAGLALVGVALTSLLVGGDRASLIVGALAGVLTFGVATSAPYVTGAVLLVGGGVIGAPLAFVVLAVGAGVAGLVHALRGGTIDDALGAGLLLAAGVPGTLLGALGVVVAVALLADAPGGEAA
ncbi:hypothetical protein G9464_16450 [Halostella sp. JP-L12]|uniref:hypothetical protein n=1 Tax=Halostella TaxID=1843185 RepID=UPI000EF7EAE2|nr:MULTISPECIES: hypothetical protein [Halostella]NHN49171.1 hypothetical protein [Halostella sp. JP-L12]